VRIIETYPNDAKIDIKGPFWAIKPFLQSFRDLQAEKAKEEPPKTGFVRNEG